MSDVRITTNHHQRDLFPAAQLTNAQLNHFCLDYLVTEDETWSNRLFRYRDWVYDAHEFEPTQPHGQFSVPADSPLAAWHGVHPQSAFDAIVIRWGTDWAGDPDYDAVIVGHATW